MRQGRLESPDLALLLQDRLAPLAFRDQADRLGLAVRLAPLDRLLTYLGLLGLPASRGRLARLVLLADLLARPALGLLDPRDPRVRRGRLAALDRQDRLARLVGLVRRGRPPL